MSKEKKSFFDFFAFIARFIVCLYRKKSRNIERSDKTFLFYI